MTLKDLVMKVQKAIGVTADGDWGPVTTAKAESYDIEVVVKTKPKPIPAEAKENNLNPAYLEAKKHAGKTERDPIFNRYLSGFWPKVGLPGYKTIIGSSFAWCGLFIAAMNTETGLEIVQGAAGARNWAKSGVAIEWKTNGIPRSAVIHINGAGNCSSASGNHVTFADGDCSPEDLARAGATVPGFGGNQGDMVKRSMYPVRNICAVRFPAEMPKPGRVLKSQGCSGSSSNESTR